MGQRLHLPGVLGDRRGFWPKKITRGRGEYLTNHSVPSAGASRHRSLSASVPSAGMSTVLTRLPPDTTVTAGRRRSLCQTPGSSHIPVARCVSANSDRHVDITAYCCVIQVRTLTHTHSLTLSHTHTHTPTLTHTHSHTLTLTLSLTHTTHTLLHTNSLTHSLTQTHSLTHRVTLELYFIH